MYWNVSAIKGKQLPFPLIHKIFSLVIFTIFFLIIGSYLPKLLTQADLADEKYHHSVPTIGDDSSYTVAAINLLHGFGFADTISLPLEMYHLDLTTQLGVYYQKTYAEAGPVAPGYSFYRGPGFPVLLSATYAVFGTDTIIARRLLAILTWLTALLLLAFGFYLADWVGTLAGGLTALYHLNYYSDPDVPTFERILTEIPTAFWLVLFAFLFSVYLSQRRWPILLGALASLTCAILTRSNFLLVLPFLLTYLYLQHRNLRELLFVGIIVLLPVGAWSLYASFTLGQPVALTTQGEIAFPQFNNLDVLEGVGPQRALQGGWNPGFVVDSNGNLTLPSPYRHAPKPGENGWIKGLTFWGKNLSRLPELFYLKLWANFWYDRGIVKNNLQPEGIYLVGIGILLMALGLRQPRAIPTRLARLEARYVLLFQLGLITLLFIFWNSSPFWLILLVWGLIFMVAWLRPYSDYYQLAKPAPTWYLAFIAGYALVTMLFGDPRFHHPLDPLLMLFGILGTLLILYELIKRNWLLMLSFLTVVAGTTLSRFGYI